MNRFDVRRNTASPDARFETDWLTRKKKKTPKHHRSLGLLCENFLHLYGAGQEELISLDEAA